MRKEKNRMGKKLPFNMEAEKISNTFSCNNLDRLKPLPAFATI
jgi:hypothetical protein